MKIPQIVDGIKERQDVVLGSIRDGLDEVDYKKLFGNIGALILGVFLSRCGIKDAIYPFGQGFFICCLMYGFYYSSAFVGCVFGWLSLFPAIPVSGLITSVGTFAVYIVFNSRFKVEKQRFLKVLFVLFSAMGVFLFNMNGRFYAIIGVLETTVAITSLFIFDKTAKALFVHKKRKRLTDDEALCLVFCLCTAVIFTGGIKFYVLEVNTVTAIILTMCFGYIFGGTVGSATGVLCGMCVALGGGSVYFMGIMGVCGFFAGVGRKWGRLSTVIFYMTANALLVLYISGVNGILPSLWNVGVAGGVFMCVPPKEIRLLKELLVNTLNQSREERYYIEKYNRLTKEKLESLSALYKTVGDLFMGDKPQWEKDAVQISSVVMNTANKHCKGCMWYQKCWEDDFMHTYGSFDEIVGEVLSGKDIRKTDLKDCVNEAGVIDTVKREIYEQQMDNKYRVDQQASNELLGKQFMGLSTMLKTMNGDIKNDIRFESDVEKNIYDELAMEDICVHDVCVMNIGGGYRCEIKMEVEDNIGHIHKATKAVSKFCNHPMVLKDRIVRDEEDDVSTLVYQMEKPIRVSSFVAQESLDGICGDSYKISHISDSRYMLCISDGMGSGKTAYEESNACVKLLYGFLKAGFEDRVIYTTVNKLLMMKSETEMFTTADLCLIDTTRATAVFTKIGGVPSVIIKSDGRVLTVRGDSLPLGLLDDIREKTMEVALCDGDMLIMFSDGIYDALVGEKGEIGREIMEIIGDNRNKRGVAGAILQECKNRNNGEKKDDMTILVSVFKKEKNG